MQFNVRMAVLLIVVVAGEYVGMRWMAQTWISGSDEARAEHAAPATADSAPATENRAETAAAAPTADWHPAEGWGGQAAASQNGAAPAAQSAAGLSAAGAPVQAAVQASTRPPPQPQPAPQAEAPAQPAPAPAVSSNTSRNAGP